jgi:hypothetical protein
MLLMRHLFIHIKKGPQRVWSRNSKNISRHEDKEKKKKRKIVPLLDRLFSSDVVVVIANVVRSIEMKVQGGRPG